jgi:Flp pilus assembly protein TadG
MSVLSEPRNDSDRISASSGGDPVGVLGHVRNERGQGVLEFAMVLPLLAVIVFVLIDFGKALYYYIDLTHIANEGARIAAVSQATMPGGGGDLGAYLCGQLGSSNSELRSGSPNTDRAQVQISYDNGGSQNVGDPVTVTVQTNYHWLPFTGLGALNIAGSATMRIENPPAATGADYSSYSAPVACP